MTISPGPYIYPFIALLIRLGIVRTAGQQRTNCAQCNEYRRELEEQDLIISEQQKQLELRAGKTVCPHPVERVMRGRG